MGNPEEKAPLPPYHSSSLPPNATGMTMTACCTCATFLSDIPRISLVSEKPASDKKLECCARTICADCIDKNPRFLTYCPYCQTSGRRSSSSSSSSSSYHHFSKTSSSSSPPPYSSRPQSPCIDPPSSSSLPPPYTLSPTLSSFSSNNSTSSSSSSPSPHIPPPPPPQDLKSSTTTSSPEPKVPTTGIIHHLRPTDTISSLSLLYSVPAEVLRRQNKIPSDHLLFARKFILVPPGRDNNNNKDAQVSHSPNPVESEEESLRKSKIRRWMMATKESDYDVAVTYLEGSGYELESAVDMFWEDVEWERMNPLGGGGGGGGKNKKVAMNKRRFWGLG